MKKLLFLLAMIAFVGVSCGDDNGNEPGEKVKTKTLVLRGERPSDTGRMMIVGTTPQWEEGDAVRLYYGDGEDDYYESNPLEAGDIEEGGKYATFTFWDIPADFDATGKTVAYGWNDLVFGNSDDSENIEGWFDMIYCTGTVKENMSFTMIHQCGYLKFDITLPAAGDANYIGDIDKIDVIAKHGDFQFENGEYVTSLISGDVYDMIQVQNGYTLALPQTAKICAIVVETKGCHYRVYPKNTDDISTSSYELGHKITTIRRTASDFKPYVKVGGTNWAIYNLVQDGSTIKTQTSHNEGQSDNAYWQYGNLNSGVQYSVNQAPGSWTAANDPARQGLGENWRIPTKEELLNLFGGYVIGESYNFGTLNQITASWGQWNSRKIVKFADAQTGNAVFLPASGSKYDTGTSYSEVDYYGYYWSNEINSSQTGYQTAYTLCTGYNPAATAGGKYTSTVGYFERRRLQSIRPVYTGE